MSFAIDVYLSRTITGQTEGEVLRCVMSRGGLCTHRDGMPERIELTIEFGDQRNAEQAVNALLNLGYHVEGPYDY